uniref:TetR/AcrR family transcriptional regulator n=1 Tax=Agathobacter sp. TaxID=2021311 RepID=UPI0040564F49
MNHKDNRRVKITKKVFQESLLELLQTQSIHEISIRTLCEKADLNRSTFYKYYGSQYDLLKEMEDELLSQIEKVFSENNPISTYKEQITQLLVFSLEHEQLCKFLFNANIDPDFPKRLLSLPAIDYALEQAAGLKKADPNQTLYRQDFYFYGGYQVIKRWINNENRESPEQMAEFFMQFMDFERRANNPPLQMHRALSDGYGGLPHGICSH